MSEVNGSENRDLPLRGSNGVLSDEASRKTGADKESTVPRDERPHFKIAPLVGWSVQRLRYWMRDHQLSVKTTSESQLIQALAKAGHTLRGDLPRSNPITRKENGPSLEAVSKARACLEKVEKPMLLRLSMGSRASPIELNVLHALLYLRGEEQ